MTTRTKRETRALRAYTCLMRAATSVTERVHRHLGEDRLTIGQFAVLEALLHLGPMHQKSLCAKLLTSGSNMTMVIDNLERRRLVERRPDSEDRRAKVVELTRSGRTVVSRRFTRHVAVLLEDFAVMTAGELDTLARLCRKLGLHGRSPARNEGKRQ